MSFWAQMPKSATSPIRAPAATSQEWPRQ